MNMRFYFIICLLISSSLHSMNNSHMVANSVHESHPIGQYWRVYGLMCQTKIAMKGHLMASFLSEENDFVGWQEEDLRSLPPLHIEKYREFLARSEYLESILGRFSQAQTQELQYELAQLNSLIKIYCMHLSEDKTVRPVCPKVLQQSHDNAVIYRQRLIDTYPSNVVYNSDIIY